jgi:hypothetical protein
VQITALPPDPKGKAVRWNLWILDAIRDELSALAAERDVSPSQLGQELLWKELRREEVTRSQRLAFGHSEQSTTMNITDHRMWQIGCDTDGQAEET